MIDGPTRYETLYLVLIKDLMLLLVYHWYQIFIYVYNVSIYVFLLCIDKVDLDDFLAGV